ncbi:MAG: hypothetical protein AAB801_00435, partial [Patescibacteria group bacterium]
KVDMSHGMEVYRSTEGLRPGQIYVSEVMTVRGGGDDVWIEKFKRRVGSTQNDPEKGLTVYTKNEINKQDILVNPHELSEPLRVRWVPANPIIRTLRWLFS